MTRTGFLLFLAGLGLVLRLPAQTLSARQLESCPDTLQLDCSHTSLLVFASRILSVDLGDARILAAPMYGSSNVLKLKAASPSLPDCNLSVLTANGHLYRLWLRYGRGGALLDLSAAPPLPAHRIVLEGRPLTEGQMRHLGSILSLETLRGGRWLDVSASLSLRLQQVYVCEGLLLLRLSIQNRSSLPFREQDLSCRIGLVHPLHREAPLSRKLALLYRSPQRLEIPARSSALLLLWLEPLRLHNGQMLELRLRDRDGSRGLSGRIGARMLRRARRLQPPGLQEDAPGLPLR